MEQRSGTNTLSLNYVSVTILVCWFHIHNLKRQELQSPSFLAEDTHADKLEILFGQVYTVSNYQSPNPNPGGLNLKLALLTTELQPPIYLNGILQIRFQKELSIQHPIWASQFACEAAGDDL